MMVPDTLDLRDRARLAIRHMISNRDEKTGYPYFYIHVRPPLPHATHNGWDLIDQLSRYIDSLILAREMTGDTTGMDVEENYRRLLVENINPGDGLAYRPKTPWSMYEAEMFDQGRALNALVTWYLKERTAEVARRAERMIDGLWNSAIHIVKRRPGYAFCYYPYASRFEDGWNPATPGETCCYSGGSLILPLVKYAEATGNEKALELAGRFMHYVVDESRVFRRDGSFWPDEMQVAHGHFHTRSLTMAGVLRYALLVGRPDLVDWVSRAFDWAMTTSGSFGWFPEGVGTEDWYTTKHSETCNITDMLHIALKLGEAGYEEYWDHAERFIRNHLLESQWSREDWFGKEPAELPPDDDIRSYRHMRERIMGGFAGRTRPNEFVADGVLLGCCCGAGPRALFLAWDHIVRRRPDGLYVNLHLNRFSREADVLSHLPHRGRVDVHLRGRGPLFIRLPRVEREACAITKNGGPVPYELRGRYARISEVKPGDRVSLEFPLETVEREEPLLDWRLRIRWRGETVIALAPSGSEFPLYERGHLERAEAPLREIDSEKERTDASFTW